MNNSNTDAKDAANAAAADEAPTTQVPQSEQTSPSPADTWELPGGKPPESPARELPGEMPSAAPERDVWSGPRRPAGPNAAAATSAPHAPQGVRASTLVWGLFLLVLGGLLLAVALGARIDLITAVILLLSGVGVALLVMALLPRRKPDVPGT
ncbi:hypothetical protein [Actinomyces sp.]|uniref:hypothetical protein n=1 Tax=Actinomyces sp. TaxID=29317 RepID=UPI0026DCA1B8|nr:hypothetical protein [Actinomyces sp.]MDO4900301.1 hypothetical protein [Actinomyces sp.]